MFAVLSTPIDNVVLAFAPSIDDDNTSYSSESHVKLLEGILPLSDRVFSDVTYFVRGNYAENTKHVDLSAIRS